MPSWNPNQYLKFDDERTRPCRDLVQRIGLEKPHRIVDLGCGPGNSTEVLAERWPEATLIGFDNSEQMILTAREKFPRSLWQVADITSWAAGEPQDLVFSNAALQWVPDHKRVLPRLFQQVKPGGALAFQVPVNIQATAHRLMREVAATPAWRSHFPNNPREWFAHDTAFYYEVLASEAVRLDLWTTEYFHVLQSPDAIVEWYKGTGLRPFLDQLPDETEKNRFLADYRREIEKAFPRQNDGCVLFPFLRLFVIAYRR